MFRKAMLAAVVAGALATGATPALADDPVYQCRFNALHQSDATGQNFEGAAWGTVDHAGGGTVSITCTVEVNGTPVSSTPTGTGTDGRAATAARVTYAAGDTDKVELCAIATAHTPPQTYKTCFETTRTQIPPQEVIDLLIDLFDQIDAALAQLFDSLNDVIEEFVDGPLCAELKEHAGTYTVGGSTVVITDEGDIYVDGEFIWNCPPY